VSDPRSSIARRFAAAAATYDGASAIQRQVAAALAERVGQAGLPPDPRVAELGCGTGYLTERLLPRLRPRLWLASDIAPAMLTALSRRIADPALALACIDAQAPGLASGFDLVCSSLTLQWLGDPAGALARWRAAARPGGLLAFSTLLDGSFQQWRDAVCAAGAPRPGPGLPSLEALADWLGPEAEIQTLRLAETHADGLAFLRAARRAGIDAGLGRPLTAGAMRRAIAAFEAGGATVNYRVALVLERT